MINGPREAVQALIRVSNSSVGRQPSSENSCQIIDDTTMEQHCQWLGRRISLFLLTKKQIIVFMHVAGCLNDLFTDSLAG